MRTACTSVPVPCEECGSGAPRATQHSHAQVPGAAMDQQNRLMIQACTSAQEGARARELIRASSVTVDPSMGDPEGRQSLYSPRIRAVAFPGSSLTRGGTREDPDV